MAATGAYLAITIQSWLKTVITRYRIICWTCLLIPFFVSSLMTGYCYRDTSMALVHRPWLRELLYALIVTMQITPVAVVIVWFSPLPAATDSSRHLASLFRLSLFQRLQLLLRSRHQYTLAAFCTLFLLSFHESDLAALMQASGWPEWMFTKHVGGLHLRESVRLSLWPLVIQIPFLLPIAKWLTHNEKAEAQPQVRQSKPSVANACIAILWIIAASAVVVAIPLIQLIKGTATGIASLPEQPSTVREVLDGILLATTVTLCVAAIVTVLRRRQRMAFIFFALLAGSLGSLTLGLLLAAIFQTSVLNLAYDTPLPLLIGEVAVILPRSLILYHCLGKLTAMTSGHWLKLFENANLSKHLLLRRELAWRLIWHKRIAFLITVWFWTYFEVMLPSILAMPGFSPIGWVLYNNLHYGQIAALAAKLMVMLLVPLVMILSLVALRFGYCRFTTFLKENC